MSKPSKVNRRRLVRLKSPKRCNPSRSSKSRERRQRSVSPSRSRWRDDIRKMKSWRGDAEEGNMKEKKCYKALGSSLSKKRSRVQLKKKIKQLTRSRTDKIVLSSEDFLSDIHKNRSAAKSQTLNEGGILQLSPSEEINHSTNTEEMVGGRDFFKRIQYFLCRHVQENYWQKKSLC